MKKYIHIRASLSLLLSISLSIAALQAQISTPVAPQSFREGFPTQLVPTERMKPVDTSKLEKEQKGPLPFRFGFPIPVELGLDGAGAWTDLGETGRVWRLRILSPGALSLNLIYQDFFLPPGATFHLYGAKRTGLLGAFTEKNNRPSGSFSTSIIKGEACVLEYFEPREQRGKGSIRVSRVVHGYRDINHRKIKPQTQQKNFGNSAGCQRNINCAEGDSWQDHKKSVAMVLNPEGVTCTGTLLNNVKQDGRPFILTSTDCLWVDEQEVESMTFIFNYESPGCENMDGSRAQSISGSMLRARNPYTGFMLLELHSPPPTTYDVWYAGWSRQDVPPTTSTSIHHPDGDVKKINVDNDPAVAFPEGIPEGEDRPSAIYLPNSFWEVRWDLGVAANNSVGPGLFDQNGRIVGQEKILYIGDASCGSGRKDYFGRFATSWDHGETRERRLSDWLDPDGTGAMTLDGMSRVFGTPQAPAAPRAPTFRDITSSSLTAEWHRPEDRGSDISGYELERRDGEAGTFSNIFTGTGRSFSDSSLPAGQTYYYRVRATNGEGASAFSDLSEITINSPGAQLVMVDGGDPVVACGRVFTDSEGSGASYHNDEEKTMTLIPSAAGEKLRVVFRVFELEEPDDEDIYDLLTIYHGTSAEDDEPIGIYSGGILPPPVTSQSPDGALTFVFESDDLVTFEGWEADVICLDPSAGQDRVPQAPRAPRFRNILSTLIDVKWEPNDIEDQVLRYILQARKTGDADFTTLSSESSDNFFRFSSDIEPGATYIMRVQAVNTEGSSGYSAESEVTAEDTIVTMMNAEVEVCGPMTFSDSGGLDFFYENGEDFTLTLSPSEPDKWIHIEFDYFSTEQGASTLPDRLLIFSGGVASGGSLLLGAALHVAPLTSGSADGKLTFVFRSDGSVTSFGWKATITCSDDPASPPSAPRIGRIHYGQILDAVYPVPQATRAFIDFAPPLDNGGSPITHYRSRWMEVGAVTPGSWATLDESSRRSNFIGNTGTSYTFHVQAVNGAGGGAIAEVTVIALVPPERPHVRAQAGDGEVTLEWTPPGNTGGGPITEFQYGHGSAPATWISVGPDMLRVVISGLVNGQSYRFSVRASNGRGWGQRRSTGELVPMTPLPSPPEVPRDLALVTAADEQLSFEWQPPMHVGLPPLTHYEYSTDGETWTSTGDDATTRLLEGLVNGVTVEFQVRAVNTQGEGPSSAVVEGVPFANPQEPVLLEPGIGSGFVLLTWQEAADNGGLPLTHYEYSTDGGATSVSTGGTELSIVVNGLVNGQTYRFQIRAFHAMGSSPWSNMKQAAPDAGGELSTPGAPTVVEVNPGNMQIEWVWTAPGNTGGLSLTGYEYSFNENPWVATTETSVTLTGLVNGTPYTFIVRALNFIGSGTGSAEMTATPFTLPGRPISLAGTAGDGQVVLMWTAPLDNGGSEVIRYEYSPNRGSDWISTASAETQFTVTGLQNDRSYIFVVRAVNARGHGDKSSEKTVRPRNDPEFGASVASGGTLDLGSFPVGDVSSLTKTLTVSAAYLTGYVTAKITAGYENFGLRTSMQTVTLAPIGGFLNEMLTVNYRGATSMPSPVAGTLTFTSNADPEDFSEYVVRLERETLPAPVKRIAVTPSEGLDFGELLLRQEVSRQVVVKLENFVSSDVVGVQSSNLLFVVSASNVDTDAALTPAGHTLTVTTLELQPGGTAGAVAGNLVFSYSADSSVDVTIPLRGTFVLPDFQATTPSNSNLDFGTFPVGDAGGGSKTVTVTATGLTADVTATITAGTSEFGLGAGGSQTSKALMQTSGNLSQALTLTWIGSTSSVGIDSGTLTLASDADPKDFVDYVVNLVRETVSPGARRIVVEPTEGLDFGELLLRQEVSRQVVVKLENFIPSDVVEVRSSDPLFVVNPSNVDTDAALTPAGHTLTVTLELQAGGADGAVAGELTFSYAGGGTRDVVIPLQGVFVLPAFQTTAPPNSILDFGAFVVGDEGGRMKTLTVTGTGLTGNVTATITAGTSKFGLGTAGTQTSQALVQILGNLSESLTLTWKGSAGTAGIDSATLTFVSAAFPKDFPDHSVRLQRETVAKEIMVTPTTLDIGQVQQGASGTASFTVRVTGFDAAGDMISITASNPLFGVTPGMVDIGQALGASGFEVTVSFLPELSTPEGTVMASIDLSDGSSPAATASIQIQATVTAEHSLPDRSIELSPAGGLNFGRITAPGLSTESFAVKLLGFEDTDVVTMVSSSPQLVLRPASVDVMVAGTSNGQAIQVDLTIPQDTSPGAETATIELSWATNTSLDTSLEVRWEVYEIALQSLAIRADATRVLRGASVQIHVDASPPGASTTGLAWEIREDTGRASVSPQGMLMGTSAGLVTVYAETAGPPTISSNELEFRIIEPVMTISVTGAGGVEEVEVGSTLQMEASVLPEGADSQVVWSVWASSAGGSISPDGLLSAEQEGTVTVQATATDGTGIWGQVEVRINPLPVTTLGSGPPEATGLQSLRVYPNPAYDWLRVEGEQVPSEVEVFSMAGFPVGALPVTQGRVDLGGLDQGLFLLLFRGEGAAVTTMKLLVTPD